MSDIQSARSPASVLIVGCGDIGTRLALRLQARGMRPRGLVFSPGSQARLAAQGIDALALDLDCATARDLAAVAAADVVWLAPPPDTGDHELRLRRYFELAPVPQRMLYLSTPAVYGDCGGAWIDEDQPLQPQTARGRRRLDGELALLQAAERHGLFSVRVRVPGIYGPGRWPLQRLQRGTPVVIESESPWSNRIHADDLALALDATLNRGRDGAVYHLSDGAPSTMTDYFVSCARVLGLPEPPRISLADARKQFSAPLLSYLNESRRLKNDRMINELGVQLGYPTLAEGLRASLPATEH